MLPDRITRLLSAAVDGELSGPQQQLLERVLRKSAEARALLQQLEQDAVQLRSLPAPLLPAEFTEQLLHALASRTPERTRRPIWKIPSSPTWVGVAVAASVLLVVGIGWSIYVGMANRDHAPQIAWASDREMTPAAQPLAEAQEKLASTVPTEQPARVQAPVVEAPTLSSAPTLSAASPKSEPPAEPKMPVLTSPLTQEKLPVFRDPALSLGPRVFKLREFTQETQQKLQQELLTGAMYRMEVRCLDPRSSVERLQKALQEQGIPSLVDTDAQAVLKLGLGTDPAFAFYVEEVTAEELARVLQQLSSDESKPDSRPRKDAIGESVQVEPLNADGQQKLARLLGLSSAETLTRKGQVAAEKKTANRQALLLTYSPEHPRPLSAELRQYLERRPERRPDTVQVLLVVRSTKN